MSGIAWVFIGLGVWFIIVVASAAYREHYGIGKAKIQFLREETGTTVRVGQGSSLGEAMVDGFRKLYGDLSPASRLDTIQVRYRAMQKSLAENRGRMFQEHISACESYLRKTKKLLDEKQAEADKREAERKRLEQEAKERQAEQLRRKRQKEKERETREQEARERRAEQLRRRRQKEKEREERERQKPEHDRFVAEQRRKMSDKLRYEVMCRDGFRCQLCGVTQADGYKLHVDHIIPVSKGGKTEMSNLRTLCERCNMGKGDRIEKPPNVQSVATAGNAAQKAPQSSGSIDDMLCGCFRHAEMIELFRDRGLEYVDKTAQGGGFYFFNETMAEELKIQKCHVSYAPNGTKNTEGRPAWFVKFK